MHMADALLSPTVGGAMWVVSGTLLMGALRDVKQHLPASRIPLLGVAGAFVFAAQMINFAIPGTGSSGHISGAVLLAALLGPGPAFVALAGVLAIQAVVFGDGGILAYGCNLFNMAFFGCFLAYPLIFRPLVKSHPERPRILLAALLASEVAVVLGALGVVVETLWSGITELPLGAFAGVMVPIHLAIGLGEGLATGAVLVYIRQNLPETADFELQNREFSLHRKMGVLAVTALILGGGISLLASGKPDGLEFAILQVAGEKGVVNSGAVHQFYQMVGEKLAVLPDYAFPGSENLWGTVISGIVGTILAALLLIGVGKLLYLWRRRVS